MRFKEYGQKKNPAVVLIHPEFTRWNFFEKVIPVLAENYFVIVPVLRDMMKKRPKSVFVSVRKRRRTWKSGLCSMILIRSSAYTAVLWAAPLLPESLSMER